MPECNLPARAVKGQPPDEVTPAKDSAKHYKFEIAQHKLKWKTRCKYYFKCTVKECNHKFKSVHERNTHHKTKHSDVKYTCSVCSKVLHTPSSIKDHKYTHNCKQHICSRCNQGFLSPSHLTQHKHTHQRQCLYTCFTADCSNSHKWLQDLLRHVRNHTAVVLKCKLCTYSNTECCLIKQHQNVHSDVKKFKCCKCPEVFHHLMQRYWHEKEIHAA